MPPQELQVAAPSSPHVCKKHSIKMHEDMNGFGIKLPVLRNKSFFDID